MNTQQPGPVQQPDLAALLSQLTESIKLSASIPEERRLVSKAWMMEYYEVKATALERIIALPGFPAAIKIPGGALRWKAVEVMDWTESQNGKRTTRPDLRVAS